MSVDGSAGNIGTTLREARERRGLSLRQIANATKIAVGVLEALERNDSSRLPGGLFSRGFVRAVAVEVGLDPEETVREFVAQCPEASAAAPRHAVGHAERRDTLESDRRTAVTVLRLVMLSVPVAAVVLYLGITGRRVLDPSKARGPGAAAGRNGPADRAGARSAPGNSEGAPGPTSVPSDTKLQTAVTLVTAQAPPSDTNQDRLTVGLFATRPCWVSATVDGRVEPGRMFEAGEQRSFEVHRELVLTAGDAGAITMTLNGADAKPFGKAGQVVTARVNLDNFKQYLLEQ